MHTGTRKGLPTRRGRAHAWAMPIDWKQRPDLRRISVALPTRLIVTLDQWTPTTRSRASVITEAVQEFLERHGVEVPASESARGMPPPA